jgi:hypothetical protein
VARRCHSMWFTPRLHASHRGKKLVANFTGTNF